MFGLFIFAAFGLAFGGLVTHECKSLDLNTKECVEHVKEGAVYEYPSK